MQRRERILATLVAVLVGGWVLDQAVLGPALAWYDRLRSEADKAHAANAEARVLVDQQARIMADWRSRHAAGLLDDEAAARFRVQQLLAGSARQSGFTIDSVSGGQLIPPGRGQTCSLLRLTASGQGGLAQVMGFVAGIEGAAMPLRIERCEMSANDPRKDALEAAVTVSTRIVPVEGRAARRIPEGTAAWKPATADPAPAAAVLAAKPFLGDRRSSPRSSSVASSSGPAPVATAPAGWALVGIVVREGGAVAFLRNRSGGEERLLRAGEEIDGRRVEAIGAAGMTLGAESGAVTIAVGCDLTGTLVPVETVRPAAVVATSAATPASPTSPAPATPAAAPSAPFQAPVPAPDPDREAILQRLRQQRNRVP